MPRIIDELTPEEVQRIKEIDEEYRPMLDAARDKVTRAMDAWTNAGNDRYATGLGDAMSAATDEETALHDKWLEARAEVMSGAERRLFSSYEGSVEAIIEMIKGEVPRIIALNRILAGDEPTEKERKKREAQAQKHRQEILDGIDHNESLLEENPDDAELIKATEELKELLRSGAYELRPMYDLMHSDEHLRESIQGSFAAYFSFLQKTAPEEYKELWAYIDGCIADKKRIYEDTLKKGSEQTRLIDDIRTRKPTAFITPVDKVSNKAFADGILYSANPLAVALEKRGSKKPISTMVSLNFEEMKLQGVSFYGKKELTAYDREVHDAITTLSVEGGNEYMTVNMIYQTMTGNTRINISQQQAEAISNSITKLMYSRLVIDATEEAKAFGFEKFKYEGATVPAERVTATINGATLDCIHLLRIPPLYDYANRKNQIGRVDIRLLDSPINKSEAVITLQGYLYRRILAMKSGLSSTIVYDTIYKQLDVSAASDGALRKKKSKVRGQVKTILDYWKDKSFIAGYVENKRGQEVYSVTVRLKSTP